MLEFSWEETTLKTTIHKIKEEVEGFIKQDSHLTKFPPPMSGSMYVDSVTASVTHCKDLAKLLLITMVPDGLGRRDVLVLSQAFAQVASNFNPMRTSAMRKIRIGWCP